MINYYCRTHGDWNAERESACPTCMVEARRIIAKLARHRKLLRDAVVKYRGESTRYMMLNMVEKHKTAKAQSELRDLMDACAPPKPCTAPLSSDPNPMCAVCTSRSELRPFMTHDGWRQTICGECAATMDGQALNEWFYEN